MLILSILVHQKSFSLGPVNTNAILFDNAYYFKSFAFFCRTHENIENVEFLRRFQKWEHLKKLLFQSGGVKNHCLEIQLAGGLVKMETKRINVYR